ncbi:MAG: type II toxin-antitoxin system prevent-host-death family antitoxin [Candidatus Bipolaricaulota bacterium]|nr:type II toxin-antitoxin system prevent-host-death family antitoxin [Candidatus Bipolaricaulota bacterium]
MSATVTTKQLRYQTSSILKRVMAGERLTVTLRGKPAAVLAPVEGEEGKLEDRFEPLAFGLWKARKDIEDVQAWLGAIRHPRSKQ